MWHATWTPIIQGDSRLLVVGSQIDTLITGFSFGHNLCCKYSNESYDPILDIYVLKAFQWYKCFFNPMNFHPSICSLKIQDSVGTPTPKMKVHLRMWVWVWLPSCTFSLHLFMPLPWSWPQVLQPYFEKSVKMRLTLSKMELGSLSGLSKIQSSIIGVKTPCIEVFFISLESYQSVDVENGLAWAIWTSTAQVMAKRKAESQIGSLTPDH